MPVSQLTSFFEAIKKDNRISPSHISLYMALFEIWNRNEFQNPLAITRKHVMGVAKIGGIATYHKCMKDLADFGYIQYVPSKNPSIKSKVYFQELNGISRSE